MAAGGGSGTDRAGELAGGRQLQAAGLGSLLPLQPERQERPHTGKFRVPLHCPIPIHMVRPQELRPRCGARRSGPGQGQELQVAAPAADAQWGRASVARREVQAPPPQQQHLWLGLFFFSGLLCKKIITMSQLLAGVWVPWLRQGTGTNHTRSPQRDFHLMLPEVHVRLGAWGYFHNRGNSEKPLFSLKQKRKTHKNPPRSVTTFWRAAQLCSPTGTGLRGHPRWDSSRNVWICIQPFSFLMLHNSPCCGVWSYLSESHHEGPCEVFLRAFLVSEPTMAQIIGRTEQRYLEGLFCLLPCPNLFPFDFSITTDKCFLQARPQRVQVREKPLEMSQKTPTRKEIAPCQH